ncbi:hypothetical protein [Devosia sp.]|uniref:hypothetical protein n=1 Tax=Devosia sp. TaxID=1871048 RepID=UPI002FCC6BE8
MTKTFSLTITLAAAIIGLAAAAAPAQAATRLMTSSLEGFEYRCEHHGGAFSQDGNSVACQTPSVPVACEFFTATRADCSWPGIENQIDVIRVIGTLTAGASSEHSGGNGVVGNGGGGGKGGGFQGPNDIKDAPNNNPKPNFNGPNEFQMAP